MKKIKTSIELAEEQLARKAYRRKQVEYLIGNEVCNSCGGTGIGEDGWTCGKCDGMGVVYEGK